MLIVKSPLRISLFGGSTDYKSFYREKGAFLIGGTINKHVYLSMRYRARILGDESIITYSRSDIVNNWDDIKNPLIRETLKYRGLNKPIDFNSFSDIPSRTGLGGSSAFCVGLLHLINRLQGEEQSPYDLACDAIRVERHILNEAGGIQDQIWPSYGGLNTIEILTNGTFKVKPLAVTREFQAELENSMLLIYTNDQREQDTIAKSHDKQNKDAIKQLALTAHEYFLKEDIKEIGQLLWHAWEEKRKISNLISTPKIDTMVEKIMSHGAYGVKLLGAGGCGFIVVMCNPKVKRKLQETFADNIMDFEFTNQGVSEIFST